MKSTHFCKTMRFATAVAAVAIMVCLNSCGSTAKQGEEKQYSATTQELIDMVNGDEQLKALLTKAIEKCAKENPDRAYNPAQTLEEYYDFIELSQTALPWTVLDLADSVKLYDRIDQCVDYFYYINDIPLDELDGKGLYNNSLQYLEPYKNWIVKYCKSWGEYLSKPESWKPEYVDIVKQDESFGLTYGWYESPENWHCFNDFFCRYLSSPDARPIAEPDNDAVVASPADSKPQGVWAIDANSDIVQKEGVNIKSRNFNSVKQLLGPNTKFGDKFANGTLTHSFLDVNDYHRYHFPVSGKIVELEVIAAEDAGGGFLKWDAANHRYILECDVPGWQMIETRGLVIVETKEYGYVALLPIGMSQISSVNFESNLKVGDTVKKGDMLGYFLFGGSDFVLVFQEGVKYTPSTETFKHVLMGEEIGRFSK